jgi:hypothetical protein
LAELYIVFNTIKTVTTDQTKWDIIVSTYVINRYKSRLEDIKNSNERSSAVYTWFENESKFKIVIDILTIMREFSFASSGWSEPDRYAEFDRFFGTHDPTKDSVFTTKISFLQDLHTDNNELSPLFHLIYDNKTGKQYKIYQKFNRIMKMYSEISTCKFADTVSRKLRNFGATLGYLQQRIHKRFEIIDFSKRY